MKNSLIVTFFCCIFCNLSFLIAEDRQNLKLYDSAFQKFSLCDTPERFYLAGINIENWSSQSFKPSSPLHNPKQDVFGEKYLKISNNFACYISSTRENPTKSIAAIPITIQFSEAVVGFVEGDVTVTRGTRSGFTGAGDVYTFNITDLTGDGNPTVAISKTFAAGKVVSLNYTHILLGADGSDVTFTEGAFESKYVLVPRTQLPDSSWVPAFYCGKFVAANNGAGGAKTVSAATPWVSINWTSAKTACTSVGASMISEDQWLAVANNVLNVNSNWTEGTKGSGMLFRGHSDGDPANVLDSPNSDSDGYVGTGNSSGLGPEQCRMKTLSNTAKIWDIGGNIYQWVDQIQAANELYTGNNAVWTETNAAAITNAKIKTAYTSGEGVGQISSVLSVTESRAFLRSGDFSTDIFAGSFLLCLEFQPTYSDVFIGFRCVR
ncbi:MAG: hypothetical protein HQM10_19340 [Candidatus Riflebacteria bacterium]|nr:hypothetical protein [Candidatus Riflebacteria bacterium]